MHHGAGTTASEGLGGVAGDPGDVGERELAALRVVLGGVEELDVELGNTQERHAELDEGVIDAEFTEEPKR